MKVNNKISVALFEPEIPQNVAAIMRTCACFDVDLILIEPLGFIFSPEEYRRIKMDYNPSVIRYSSFNEFINSTKDYTKILFTSHTKTILKDITVNFDKKYILLFGKESSGVSEEVASYCDKMASIPMCPRSRSLNLSVSVGIGVNHFIEKLNIEF